LPVCRLARSLVADHCGSRREQMRNPDEPWLVVTPRACVLPVLIRSICRGRAFVCHAHLGGISTRPSPPSDRLPRAELHLSVRIPWILYTLPLPSPLPRSASSC
jgi:hypothetical protein